MRLHFLLEPFRRSLGLRIAVVFVLFFALVLVLIGLLFRDLLSDIQLAMTEEMLESDWAALKTYLNIQNGQPVWLEEPGDAEVAYAIARLRRIFMLADEQGRILDLSAAYRALGPEDRQQILQALHSRQPQWRVHRDPWGVRYLIRSGVFDESGRHYYVSLGRSLALNDILVDRFTFRYFSTLPLMLLGGGLLGWFLTRRMLRPLQDLVRTSESITGSNLSLRLQPRGAGDELDRLMETFNRMMERLEASFQQMKQFTTDVSHELRTPITAVRGQLEVALLASRNEEELREAISSALEETERLSQLVRAMLALSQAESGQTALRFEPHDLVRLTAEILDQFKIPADEAGLTLQAELPPACEAEVDRVQYERLLNNLLSNAIKYTPAGGRVQVRLKCEHDLAVLSVEDTGIGIPPEHLPRIFERFYRVPGTPQSSRGLGLGLSFVAWIVKAHGGTIDVASQPGKGSCFTVKIPRRASLAGDVLAPNREKHKNGITAA